MDQPDWKKDSASLHCMRTSIDCLDSHGEWPRDELELELAREHKWLIRDQTLASQYRKNRQFFTRTFPPSQSSGPQKLMVYYNDFYWGWMLIHEPFIANSCEAGDTSKIGCFKQAAE
jgi:hypothetical protein